MSFNLPPGNNSRIDDPTDGPVTDESVECNDCSTMVPPVPEDEIPRCRRCARIAAMED